MRLSSVLIPAAAFLIAAVFSVISARYAADAVEDFSEIGVRAALDTAGHDWAEVQANGLQVVLTGTAPTEARRFAALSTAGGVVDAARVIDELAVLATGDVTPPRFSVEMLRNDSGISLIGLIPTAPGREAILSRLAAVAGDDGIKDFLETADYPTPDGWSDALDFALEALVLLPRSKISVDRGKVSITAISDGLPQKTRWETQLARRVPASVQLAMDISAPRPVITPFTLRFLINESGARFDACSADTPDARIMILAAARAAGLEGKADCRLGLGVPSPTWSTAASRAIAGLAELGQGSLTFSDADVTLIAAEGSPQADFDRIVGELEAELPEIFTLHAVLPTPPEATESAGPPEFTATLSPEGQVQLRGRLKDEIARTMADSLAKARFGADTVYTAARLDGSLPDGWSVRVLAGLEALAALSNGALRVTPEQVSIRGNTGNAEASSLIAQLLSAKLGEAEDFAIDVTYVEALDPIASIPTPEECIASINAILDGRKITFEPSSATIDSAARGTMDAIAEVLKQCGEIRIEIAGHTDSQGREIMNEQLSQQRAESVLNELRQRRVLTSTFKARGYGEAQPIADNDTEEGREANRRIEFTLIVPKPIPETETTLESVEQSLETERGQTEAPDSGEDPTTPPEDTANEQN